MKNRTFAGARLRPKKDDDIKEGLKGIEEGDISELVRKGLRLVLNIKKPQPKVLDWSHLK